jgi:hypothetical protein
MLFSASKTSPREDVRDKWPNTIGGHRKTSLMIASPLCLTADGLPRDPAAPFTFKFKIPSTPHGVLLSGF